MGEEDSGAMTKAPAQELAAESEPKRNVDVLQAEIQASRERITQSLESLHHEVEERLDWRGWVRDNPWKAVGFAAAFGFYLGAR